MSLVLPRLFYVMLRFEDLLRNDQAATQHHRFFPDHFQSKLIFECHTENPKKDNEFQTVNTRTGRCRTAFTMTTDKHRLN